jgi:hypothetical protein
MALNCVAQGTATVTETIFENRYMHVDELLRLGARIQVDGRVAVVEGLAWQRRTPVGRDRDGDRLAGLRQLWSSPAWWPRARPWWTASTTWTAATTAWKPSCAA